MSTYYPETQISHTTFHSLKAYSTISHMFSKGRKDQPLSLPKMNNFHTWTFRQLQQFCTHMRTTAKKTTKNIRDYGISARLEISIRPNNGEVAKILRYGGDLSDVLLHVHVGLHDILYNNHRKLCITLSPLEPVRAKTDFLLDVLLPMLQLRAGNVFCTLYKDPKIHAWLKAIANLIMVTVGIAPNYNLKFVRSWIKDDKRFDPTNEASLVTSNFLHVSSEHNNPAQNAAPVIPHTLRTSIQSILHQAGISTDGIAIIILFLDRKDSHSNCSISLQCFQSLSLHDKLV